MNNPIMLVGNTSSEPGSNLHEVAGAVRWPNGEITVGDRGSHQIKTFDSAGQLAHISGGSGGGPGEFMVLWRIWLIEPDTIGAYDPVNRRVSYWTKDGQFVRSQLVPLNQTPLMVGRLVDGKILTATRWYYSRNGPVEKAVADSVSYAVLDLVNRTSDTVGTFVDHYTFPVRNDFLGGNVVFAPVPATPRATAAVGPNSFYLGTGESWRITEYDPSGSPIRILEPNLPIRTRSADDAAMWLESAIDALAQNGVPRTAARSYFTKFPQPQHYPTYDSFAVDNVGKLWVRNYVAPHDSVAIWHIIDADGGVDGIARTPPDFTPYQFGNGWVLGLILGDHDLEMVGVFPMEVNS